LQFVRRLHLGDALKNRTGHAGRVALNAVALAAMVAASSSTWALGLGRLSVQSALGETLRAEIDITSLSSEEDSSLRVRIAPPESYRAAGVDYNAVLPSATVTLARRADGRPYLRVTSDRAVQEPFVDVILELTWSSGRLVREYTLLLDPPQSRVAPPVMAQAPAVPQISAAPQPIAPTPSQGAVAAAPSAPQAAAPMPTPRPAPTPRVAAQRPSPAAPAGAPSGEGEYKVKEGDTLYRIAKGNQRANVSLDQMLVALFRNNPNAFIGDNMNRLKAGAVLNVPSSEQAGAVTTAEARETIRAQSADFGAYRQRLAGNVPTTPAGESSRQATGKVQAAIDDRKQAAAPTPDKLTLSQGAVKPGGAGTEAKVSKETEKKDAATRVAELAKNIEDLKKVQQGAPATAAAPAQPAAPAPAAPAAPAPEAKAPTPTPTPAAPPTPPAPPPVAQAPAEPPKAEPATPSVPITPPASPAPEAAASVPAAAPKPAAPMPAPPVEEPGMLASLTDSPYAVPGGIGLAVLLAGLAMYRLRGRFRKDNGETSFLESRLQPDSFFGASGGQRVDTRDAASGVSSSMSYSLSQLDAIGDVDPVAEADVYLAYGRDLQAEEILKEAMRGNPDRLAIRTKLLEVYAKRRDTKGFEMLATQLYSLTKGEGDDWSKAQELGRQIDPENPLYKPGGQPAAAVTSDGGRIIEPLGASTMPQSIMPHTSGFPTSAIDSTSGTDSRSAPDLDLDLDLGTMPPPSAPSRREAQPSRPPIDLESISLDLNPSASMPLNSGGAAASSAKPTLDFGDFTLPAQPSGHGAFDDNDPLARKLELAEEFRQIGDMEGARDLLEEVVAKAGGALKTKAQSMLDSLA
jgi:pilus assembly protein FimV